MNTIKYLDLQKINLPFSSDAQYILQDIIESGHYLYGKYLNTFEESFAKFCNTKYCIGVANGYDALTISLLALKELYHWDNNSEIIVPDFTFFASAGAILRAGLIPVFCDVNKYGLIDAQTIELHITNKTRAILAVHLYGRVCDMEVLNEIVKHYHLKLIEDAAQAHGALAKDGKIAGSIGDIAAFSFYPGKNLGAFGDAGAIVTNNDLLYKKAKLLANYGSEKKYYHQSIGLNSRLSEFQAGILSLKLTTLRKENEVRRKIAGLYLKYLDPKCLLFHDEEIDINSVYHIFAIYSQDRDKMQSFLKLNFIETLIHYPIPLHEQKAFSHIKNLRKYPMSNKIAATELSLPIYSQLSDKEILYICEMINHF